MEDRALKNRIYQIELLAFGDYLGTLGYSESTVYNYPLHLRDFFKYLEQNKVNSLEDIQNKDLMNYLDYQKVRPNKRRSGGISSAHINKQIDALQKYFAYVELSKAIKINSTLKYLPEEKTVVPKVLSRSAIKALYTAIEPSIIGQRDSAMLGIYYGCGLRKKEGLELEISDIDFAKKLLYVRHPKNGYERYVPIQSAAKKDLEIYLYQARPLLLDTSSKETKLLISNRGKGINGGTLIARLNALKNRSNHPELKEQNFGLHTLRHSIATHLMQAGMTLENIAFFLGHRSLDSTQIYTHLIKSEK